MLSNEMFAAGFVPDRVIAKNPDALEIAARACRYSVEKEHCTDIRIEQHPDEMYAEYNENGFGIGELTHGITVIAIGHKG